MLEDHNVRRWKEFNVSDENSSAPMEYVFPRDDNRWPQLPEPPNIREFYSRDDVSTKIFMNSVGKHVPRRTIDKNLTAVKDTYNDCALAMEEIMEKLTPGNDGVKIELRALLAKKFGQGVHIDQYNRRLDQLLRVKSRYHVERQSSAGDKRYEVLRTYGVIPLKKGWEKTHKILSEFHQVYLPDLFDLCRYHHGLPQNVKLHYVNCSIDGVDPTGNYEILMQLRSE